jgi:hypothetical protein
MATDSWLARVAEAGATSVASSLRFGRFDIVSLVDAAAEDEVLRQLIDDPPQNDRFTIAASVRTYRQASLDGYGYVYSGKLSQQEGMLR